jgi:transcriptional regulator with XRE-family HTH domain
MQANDNAMDAARFQIPPAVQDMIDTGVEPVHAFRLAKGLSIEELADASDVEAARIAAFEEGRDGLHWRDFEAIGKALAVPPELLPND